MQLYGPASAGPFFAAAFQENWGARQRISGGCPVRGEPEAHLKSCSSIACRAQPCQRCSPVLQALIYFQMQLYGPASAGPFFAAAFQENWGARQRISGGCPVRGEPEAHLKSCSSIACRAQPCQRCSSVLQALIISQYALLRPCFGRAVFCCKKIPCRGHKAGVSLQGSGGANRKGYLLLKSEMRSTMRIRSSRVAFSLGR